MEKKEAADEARAKLEEVRRLQMETEERPFSSARGGTKLIFEVWDKDIKLSSSMLRADGWTMYGDPR